EVPAPPHRVPSLAPDHEIGEAPGLVALQQRIGVVNRAKVGKRYVRQPPVKWVLGYSSNAQVAGDVPQVGIEVARGYCLAVVIHARDVGDLAQAAHIAEGHVKTAHRSVTAYGGIRIGQPRIRIVVVKSAVQVVAFAAVPPAADGAAPERVHQMDIQIVLVIGVGGEVMKVVHGAGKVGRGNELQQPARRWVNLRLRNYAADEGQAGQRVDDGHRRTGLRAGADQRAGEVAIALRQRGDGRKGVVGIGGA